MSRLTESEMLELRYFRTDLISSIAECKNDYLLTLLLEDLNWASDLLNLPVPDISLLGRPVENIINGGES